jgi:EAL domain-containing protein (putative c-di-GMP-specific phosphodiesterase class I)
MIRFFAQPKYSLDHEKLGYEFFIRQYCNGNWIFPKNFAQFTALQLEKLAIATITALPKGTNMVSINLDQDQFVDDTFIASMQQVQKQCEPVEVVIELTEHHHNISIAKLAVAAQQYQNAHLWVCLDDVGTGDNIATLAEQLDPYITEYKFALQNFRQHTDFSTIISPLLQFWHKFAEIHHKFFAIEGFENAAEIAIGQHYHANLLQGYYLGYPELVQIDATALNNSGTHKIIDFHSHEDRRRNLQ